MSIYFNSEKSQNLDQLITNPKVPAHEKIGALFSRCIALLKSESADSNELRALFHHLGISEEDRSAMQTMSELLVQLDDGTVKISPIENAGIYFIQKKEAQVGSKKSCFNNIAVFKIGRKRACMETMARTLANSLGLSKQMVPGMFCALQNPALSSEASEEGEIIEELWNGLDKIYLDPPATSKKKDDSFGLSFDFDNFSGFDKEKKVKETACAVVGIVQPFLSDKQEASLYDYTLMTILALAIGLRDGKKDGYKGACLFDVEDCMSTRIDPVWTKEKIDKAASAIDLPYLDKDPRTTSELSLDDVGKLTELVQQWNITSIVNQLGLLKIRYEDSVAEGMKPKAKGLDEGSCFVQTYVGQPHLINGTLNHLSASNSERCMLLPEQLNACNTRLQRIHDFILDCAMKRKTFTPQELVFAVDKYGQIFHDAIRRSPHLPKNVDQILDAQGINHLIGRRSPDQMKVVIPEEDYNNSLISLATLTPTPTVAAALEQIAQVKNSSDNIK